MTPPFLTRRGLPALLYSALFMPLLCMADPTTPLKAGIAITGHVQLTPDEQKVSLHLRDVDLRDVLNMLAAQGHLNLLLDDSVKGTITVDLDNVSINKAFEYIFTIAGLAYSQDGKTVIVASGTTATTKNLNVQTFKMMRVRYKDAAVLADQLNKTLFSVPRPGGSSKAIASSDRDTNSIVVMGTPGDIQLVSQALKVLDSPRNQKIYTIRYNSPTYVAQVLASGLFPNGSSGTSISGGSGSAGAASAAPAGGSPPAGGGSSSTASSSPSTGAATTTPTGPSSFVSGGVTFVSEPITGTLTVLGSPEQIALIDNVINKVDVRRAQVSVEVSLVELQSSDSKKLSPQFNTFNTGHFSLALLPNLGGDNSVFSYNQRSHSGGPILQNFSLQNQISKLKGRILANPNVVALDGSTSTIDISDEVPTITRTTTQGASTSQTTYNITKDKAGINLSVTPRITNDGAVTLTLTPKVTQPTQQVTSPDGSVSTYLISENSINLSQVRVMDGQTLVIGGLLKDTQNISTAEIPGIANLPIVGAMFRAMPSNQKQHTELVLMVTPHIIREDATQFRPLNNQTPVPIPPILK